MVAPIHANLVEFDIFTMPSALPLPRTCASNPSISSSSSSSSSGGGGGGGDDEKSQAKGYYCSNTLIDLEAQTHSLESNSSDEDADIATPAHLARATSVLEILSTFLIFLVLALLLTDLPVYMPTYLQNAFAATSRALPLALCTGFPTAVLFWLTLNCVVEREAVEFARANVVFCWLVGSLWGAAIFGSF